jgi:hypothetical protein
MPDCQCICTPDIDDAATKLPPSEQDLIFADEIQLHTDEAARRAELKGRMSERDIEVTLETEFGERRSLLVSRMNATLRQS